MAFSNKFVVSLISSLMAIAMVSSTVVCAKYFKQNAVDIQSEKIILPNLEIKNDQTGIPDKALYNAVVFAIGDKKLPLINSEVLAVKSLNLQNQSISDINGIDKFINLQELNLDQNKLKNISEIKKLTNLKALSLSENPLKKEDLIKNVPTNFSENDAWVSQQIPIKSEIDKTDQTPLPPTNVEVKPADKNPDEKPVLPNSPTKPIIKDEPNYINPLTTDMTTSVLPTILIIFSFVLRIISSVMSTKKSKKIAI
ncbi:MAG: hypothetical protein RSA99_00080 [Oscillospiraceae bacterium]